MEINNLLEYLKKLYEDIEEEKRLAFLEWEEMSSIEREKNPKLWDYAIRCSGKADICWYIIQYIKNNGEVKIR